MTCDGTYFQKERWYDVTIIPISAGAPGPDAPEGLDLCEVCDDWPCDSGQDDLCARCRTRLLEAQREWAHA